MKKFLLVFVLVLCAVLVPKNTSAQTTTSVSSPWVWGCSPFQDSLWALDTTNWQVVRRVGPTTPGFTITGMNGMATDPTSGLTYCIMKLSAVSGRVLGRIDLMTGVCTQVGNLGDNFSSISFRSDGQLFGCTGDGATVAESFWLINKATAAKTLLLGFNESSADGDVICYNPSDSFFYHWYGNGVNFYEKVLDVVPYTRTSIPITGGNPGETFGVMFNGGSKFIGSNISSAFARWSTSGTRSNNFGGNPDDLRGIVMLPYFNASDDTICANEALTITAGGHQLFTKEYFHWGDGNHDSLNTVNGVLLNATHTYSSPGNYTVYVESNNGFGGDTIYSYVVRVNNIPVVTVSGFSTVCSGDPVTLTATSGGTSQWYFNGTIIPGATTSVYSTNQPGVYNMIKTNLNGCSDSAATGLTVVASTYPVVSLSNAVACGSYTLDAGNPGSTYAWSTGDTTQIVTLTSSMPIGVTVTNADGCATVGSANVIINTSPVVNLGPDTSVCVSYLADAGTLVNGAYTWCNGWPFQTNLLTVSGPCFVIVTDVNGCTASDTITVTILGNPTVTLSTLNDSLCATASLEPLFGGPVGGTYSGPGTTSQNFDPTAAGAGVHTIVYMYTDSNGCSASDSLTMSVFGNPTVTASATPSSVCADDADVTLTGSPAGGTFTGTSVTANSFDPSVGAGTYSQIYTYTDVNGCPGSDTTSVQVNACVGIQEAASAGFTMYPNPTTGVLNFTLTENSTVEVFDVLGNTVASKLFASGNAQLNLSNQPNGVYFVRVNGTNAQRIVIQK